jgi:hypothetical protein
MGFDPEMLKNMSLGAAEDADTEMLGTVVMISFPRDRTERHL